MEQLTELLNNIDRAEHGWYWNIDLNEEVALLEQFQSGDISIPCDLILELVEGFVGESMTSEDAWEATREVLREHALRGVFP